MSKYLLILILLLSLVLNTVGLFPNTLLHQKEPVLFKPANNILVNIFQKQDFDPNVEPHPFIYGSSIIYLHTFVRGITLFTIYNVHQLTGFVFGEKDAFSNIYNLQQFITDKTIYFFEDNLRIASRFVTVLFGVGAVYLTYIIAEILYKNRKIALFSAFALAITPLWVRDAHYSTPDIPQNFLFLAAFLFSVKLWQKPTLRNYLLAGFFIGLSSSLKYFPLSLLPFLYFHFLVSKFRFFNGKFFLSIIAIFVGYLAGMPYLFVHYKEILANFNFAAGWYAPKALADNESIMQKLIPPYFHGFHFKFALNYSILPGPLVLAIIGFLGNIKKYGAETLAVLIIPIVNTLFITGYLEVTYDYLPMPSLPFLAILIGLGCYYSANWLVGKFNLKQSLVYILILVPLIPSLISTVSSDIACSKQITEEQGKSWITESIDRGTPLAIQPVVRVASAWPEVLRSELKSRYSMEELQEKDIKFSAVISGYIQLYDIWSEDSFIPNQDMIDNQFLHLVAKEYQDRATLVKQFVKPRMCNDNELYIFKLPERLPEVNHQVKSFSFNNESDFQDWVLKDSGNLKQVQLNFSKDEGYIEKGSLYYQHSRLPLARFTLSHLLFYSPPVYSPFIEVAPNVVYTVTSWVKTTKESLLKAPDGFLRLDFYQQEDAKPLTIYLTPRATKDGWQKLTTTGVAPQEAKFLRIGFQTIAATESGKFWVDNVELLDNK